MSSSSSSSIPVQGTYTDNASGLKVDFPFGWNGFESIDSDNVKAVSISIQPQSSASSLTSPSKDFTDNIPHYIFVEISPKNTVLDGDKQLQYKNIVNYDSVEKTKSCNLISSNNITIKPAPAKDYIFLSISFNPSVKQLTKAIEIEASQVNIAIEFTAVSDTNYEKYLPILIIQ